MRGAIVLDDDRMVDRQVGRPLLEVVIDRITAIMHHLAHQRVCVADGVSRLVDEGTLCLLPASRIVFTRRRIELAKLEALVALATRGQLSLGGTTVASVLDHALVFRAKARLQPAGALLARREQRDGDEQHDDHGD